MAFRALASTCPAPFFKAFGSTKHVCCEPTFPQRISAMANFRQRILRMPTFAQRIFGARICRKPCSSERSWTKAILLERISPGRTLAGASFVDSDLSNAELRDIRWEHIADLKNTNISGVKDAPNGFVDWATKHGAQSVAS